MEQTDWDPSRPGRGMGKRPETETRLDTIPEQDKRKWFNHLPDLTCKRATLYSLDEMLALLEWPIFSCISFSGSLFLVTERALIEH